MISGNHHLTFEVVYDVLVERVGARRAWVVGTGHSSPHTGAAFNEKLEAFLHAATSR